MALPNQITAPEVSGEEVRPLRDALRAGRPLVVRGIANTWPALRRWTREHLSDRLGELVLPAHESVTGAIPDPMGMRIRKVRFADYLDSLWSGTMQRPALLDGDSALIYAGNPQGSEAFAPLRADIEVPTGIPSEALRQIGFWLSCRGVFSWLHYDNNLMDNINVQVKGSKKVTLFSPDDAPRLYLNTFTIDGVKKAQFSKIDLREPDVDTFPELKNARAWVSTLEAGDAVFIPSCWLHSFTHLGKVNMNVNFWWRPSTIPWNPVTARRLIWHTIETTLNTHGDGGQPKPVAERLCDLPAEARAIIEGLEQAVLSPSPNGWQYP